MAVIQYSGIVNQVRGKLNGSVFNKSATGFTMASKGQPPATITSEQSISRSRFQQTQQRWKLLTENEKADWQTFASNNPNRDRFGNEVILSGYNKYMECTLNALLYGSFISYPIDVTAVPPAPFDALFTTGLELQTFASGNRIFVLNWQAINPVPALRHLTFEVGKPMSRGVTNYTGSYRFMGFVSASGSASSGIISGRTLPAGWSYKDGDRVAVRLRYYVPFRGVVGYESISYVTLGNVPAITSFTSDKYSGSPPYTFTIGIFNKDAIDGINYVFEARAVNTEGSCALSPLSTPLNESLANSLLSTGTYTSTNTVANGRCLAVEVRVVHLPSNNIISLRYIHIHNL